MAEASEQEAPTLGDPTDSDLGAEAAAAAMSRGAWRGDSAVTTEAEKTMDTPDELGGTGGQQAGGAG